MPGCGYELNPGQDYLQECRDWLTGHWPQLDMLVLNADLIDGHQSKNEGTGIITTDLSEQAEIAMAWLAPVIEKLRPKVILRTIGTSYHEGFDGALKLLDARFGVAKVDHVLDVQMEDGLILNVKHEPEGSSGLYLGTTQDREALWAAITEEMQGLPKAQFLVRSHLHMQGRHDGFGKTHVLTPCWQLQAPYAMHKKYYRWQPSIGGTLLRYDELHDQGYVVIQTTFKLPRREVLTYGAEAPAQP